MAEVLFSDFALTAAGGTSVRSAVAPITSQAGTSYALALADAQTWVEFTSASAVTATVPENSTVAFPVGSEVVVYQSGAGQVTIAAAIGVTIRKPASHNLSVAEQYGIVLLKKVAANIWVASGYLTSP